MHCASTFHHPTSHPDSPQTETNERDEAQRPSTQAERMSMEGDIDDPSSEANTSGVTTTRGNAGR